MTNGMYILDAIRALVFFVELTASFGWASTGVDPNRRNVADTPPSTILRATVSARGATLGMALSGYRGDQRGENGSES